MYIDVADAETMQRAVCDRAHGLFRLSTLCRRHAPKGSRHGLTVAQASKREFANHVGMNALAPVAEERNQDTFGASEMVDPDTRVDDDDHDSARRRGPASAVGSLQPRRAMRRDTSR